MEDDDLRVLHHLEALVDVSQGNIVLIVVILLQFLIQFTEDLSKDFDHH